MEMITFESLRLYLELFISLLSNLALYTKLSITDFWLKKTGKI